MVRRPWALFFVLALAASCGDDGGAAADADIGDPFFVVSNTDSSGQTHSLTITCAELVSEAPVTLVTDGDHQHSITLSVEQLQAIGRGETVVITFTEGHEHTFSITKPVEACTNLNP